MGILSNLFAKKATPAMYVFVTEHYDTVLAMSMMFPNYYTEESCVNKVRGNFRLPIGFPIIYIPKNKWNGPDAKLNGQNFTIDLPLVNMLQLEYLTKNYGIPKEAASRAIQSAQAMQAPNLGLLWLCVKV